ncbi:MAG: GTPase HflX [Deltaproteobacteria bacterium]|nr:GTPase HflX [Deltaproteobacteria bacterium]
MNRSQAELLLPVKEVPAAIVVGIQKQGVDIEQVADDLLEMERLLETLGVEARGRIIQRRQKLSPGHLLGLGKIQELTALAGAKHASLIIIDHPLTGTQIKNLEELTSCQVLDRSAVILDIFAKHAKTKEAKTQVEIARLEYLLPRMVGAWTHFERQAGGGVYVRGMGEKQIEIDRRRARERIGRLHKKLDAIRRERDTQRKLRRNELKVSVVGYTNSGKTTVMGALTLSDVRPEDRLFATLDASIKPIDPNTRPKILLSDTVGFIQNLPPSLVASFKSTLEEVLNANLLLHIVDVSSRNYEAQMATTEAVLREIGASEIPIILVFNKIDLVDDPFLARILRKKYKGCMVISALNREDTKTLRSHIFNFFEERFSEAEISVAYDDAERISLVYRSCVILDANYEEDGVVHFHLRAAPAVLRKLI